MDNQEQVNYVPAPLHYPKSFVELPAELRSMIYGLVITQEVQDSTLVIYYQGHTFKYHVQQKPDGSITGAAQEQPETSSRKQLMRHTRETSLVQSIEAAASMMQTCRSVRNEVVPRFYRQVSFMFMPLEHGFETFLCFASTLSNFAKSFIATIRVYNSPMIPTVPFNFGMIFSGFTALQSLTLLWRSFETRAPPSGDPPSPRPKRLRATQTLLTVQKACPQLSRTFF